MRPGGLEDRRSGAYQPGSPGPGNVHAKTIRAESPAHPSGVANAFTGCAGLSALITGETRKYLGLATQAGMRWAGGPREFCQEDAPPGLCLVSWILDRLPKVCSQIEIERGRRKKEESSLRSERMETRHQIPRGFVPFRSRISIRDLKAPRHEPFCARAIHEQTFGKRSSVWLPASGSTFQTFTTSPPLYGSSQRGAIWSVSWLLMSQFRRRVRRVSSVSWCWGRPARLVVSSGSACRS